MVADEYPIHLIYQWAANHSCLFAKRGLCLLRAACVWDFKCWRESIRRTNLYFDIFVVSRYSRGRNGRSQGVVGRLDA